jgi:hypothetical protein
VLVEWLPVRSLLEAVGAMCEGAAALRSSSEKTEG